MDIQTVTAYPVVNNVPACNEFLMRVFGAKETFRAVGGAGGYHTEVTIGDTNIWVGGGAPQLSWKGEPRPMAFHIIVPDCDATYRAALDAGAKSLDEPADQPRRERTAQILDPHGNMWALGTGLKGLPTLQPYLLPRPGEGQPLLDFLAHAFGMQVDGGVRHATLQSGSSSLELFEVPADYPVSTGTYYLYVPDCDAVFARALSAGAQKHSEPADQSYGDRHASVTDLAGNVWYIASKLASQSSHAG